VDDFVLVLDIEVKTRTPGLTLNHTVREHEGDELYDNPGSVAIKFGPKKVIVNGEEKEVRRSVSIPRDSIAEEARSSRWERRTRLTVADIIDKDAAEVERLAAQFGVGKKP
jgi:hypothetical protein